MAGQLGVMNLVLPFFGGMPLCHGAGGLAGQYYDGARTGGTNILEGTIEILLGLFRPGLSSVHRKTGAASWLRLSLHYMIIDILIGCSKLWVK